MRYRRTINDGTAHMLTKEEVLYYLHKGGLHKVVVQNNSWWKALRPVHVLKSKAYVAASIHDKNDRIVDSRLMDDYGKTWRIWDISPNVQEINTPWEK